MSHKLPFMQFYPDQWLRDTRKLSPIAKAVWVDVIAYCWNEPERGIYRRTKAAMAREHSITTEEVEDVLSELSHSGVADVRDAGEVVTVVSRRIVKEERVRELARNRKQKQRGHASVPQGSRDSHEEKRDMSASVPGKKLEVRSQKLEERKEKEKKDTAPPAPEGGGEVPAKPQARKRPAAERRDVVDGWQDLIRHVDQAWQRKKQVAYPWDPHEFKKLHHLAKTYMASGVMAMWDLYMLMGTYWGKLTGYNIDGLKKDLGVIVDDPRWKGLCQKYQGELDAKAKPVGEELVSTKDLMATLTAQAKTI